MIMIMNGPIEMKKEKDEKEEKIMMMKVVNI